MRKMCTIVATVLGSALLLVSIVFIGASSRLDDGFTLESQRFTGRKAGGESDRWELVSADMVAPAERSVRYDQRSGGQKPAREMDSMLDDDLKAENSHVVVQVYSVDSDQEMTNESSVPKPPARTMKVHKFGLTKEQMDGRATDRVERKVFAPARNIQEQLSKMESNEKRPEADKEAVLQERFYVDDSTSSKKTEAPLRNRFSGTFESNDEVSDAADVEPHLASSPTKQAASTSQAFPPFFDYKEQTSQRMLDEFFTLRNQDSLAARRSNYDWDEGHFRSRTLEDIKNQNRATAASRRKAPVEYMAGRRSTGESDMDYDRYAEYAADMEHRMAASGYGPQKLGRKQRATPAHSNMDTQVLNHMPIVSTDGDSSTMGKGGDMSRSQIERSRFHYSLPSMVFNPYAWDPYHMNMLRFPQCNACQQNARALCGKCGLCSDCCAHSKCTCGCLHG